MAKKKRSSETWDGSREYVWKGQRYPSVTTILGNGVPKQKVLVPWAAKTVATWVVENPDETRRLLDGDPDIAIQTMKDAQYRTKRDAGVRGSAIHDLAEKLAEGQTVSVEPGDPIEGLADALAGYVSDRVVTPLYSEITVFSLRHGYAGSLDGIHLWGIDGRNMLIDFKTGKRAYPEVGLQLAAYAHADFYVGDDGKEAPIPKIDGAAVIHLGDAGYAIREVNIGDETFKAFRAARVIGDYLLRGDQVFLT